MLRYLTAGESHGRALVAIVEGVPAGMPLTAEFINKELARRQVGYGRGGRMRIEQDKVEILSGVRQGFTLGSPIALQIENRDWPNWQVSMNAAAQSEEPEQVTRPRPGHADLTGALKYQHQDIRNVLERASARETAIRVGVGAVARRLLLEFDIAVQSHVVRIGDVESGMRELTPGLFQAAEESDVRCADAGTAEQMREAIKVAVKAGDSLGGVFEVVVTGTPPGLGSHVHWDRKLDGRLAQALMSIQAIKGVEVGLGFAVGSKPGSQVHDAIGYDKERSPWGFFRASNNAGGLEGGMTNGEPIIIRAAMKPIATLYRPLPSVDLHSKQPFSASIERSDNCAVPAASVVGEAVVAFEVASSLLEKCGGDSIAELRRNYLAYLEELAHV